jgi:hypothetical protein
MGSAAGSGSGPSTLGVAVAMIEHPVRVLDVLWRGRTDMQANLLSAGLPGVLWPTITLIVVADLLEDTMAGIIGFSQPGFQNVIVTLLMPVGTIAVLAALSRLRQRAPHWCPDRVACCKYGFLGGCLVSTGVQDLAGRDTCRCEFAAAGPSAGQTRRSGNRVTGCHGPVCCPPVRISALLRHGDVPGQT